MSPDGKDEAAAGPGCEVARAAPGVQLARDVRRWSPGWARIHQRGL